MLIKVTVVFLPIIHSLDVFCFVLLHHSLQTLETLGVKFQQLSGFWNTQTKPLFKSLDHIIYPFWCLTWTLAKALDLYRHECTRCAAFMWLMFHVATVLILNTKAGSVILRLFFIYLFFLVKLFRENSSVTERNTCKTMTGSWRKQNSDWIKDIYIFIWVTPHIWECEIVSLKGRHTLNHQGATVSLLRPAAFLGPLGYRLMFMLHCCVVVVFSFFLQGISSDSQNPISAPDFVFNLNTLIWTYF